MQTLYSVKVGILYSIIKIFMSINLINSAQSFGSKVIYRTANTAAYQITHKIQIASSLKLLNFEDLMRSRFSVARVKRKHISEVKTYKRSKCRTS